MPVCIELAPTKGYCTYTISPDFFFLHNEEWQSLKNKSMVLPAQSWKEIKKFIMDLCKESNQCVMVEKKISQFEEQIR